MQNRYVHAGVAVAAVLLAIGASSCGGGQSIPPTAVAIVEGTPISKATLDHWTSVEFVTDNETLAQRPAPSGVVPKPPLYTACITHERETERKAASSAKAPGDAALKRRCEQHYETVREHVLNVLIVFEWYIKEGEKQGVSPADAEVKRQYARFSGEHYPHPGELRRFLTNTGETYDDELLRMKMDLLTTNLSNRELKKVGGTTTPEQQHELAQWGAKFITDWVARTSCRPGYVVPNCKEYKGSKLPDPRI
jgi:hypothetical protein